MEITRRQKMVVGGGFARRDKTRTRRALTRVARRIGQRRHRCCHVFSGMLRRLGQRSVCLCRSDQPRPFRRRFIRGFFGRRIFPFLSPIVVRTKSVHAFVHSHHLCLIVQVIGGDGQVTRPSCIPSCCCTLVGVPCTGMPHFVRLPARRKGRCVVFVSSVVQTGLSDVFPNCIIRDYCDVGVSQSTSVCLSSRGNKGVIRGVHGGIGGHGVNTLDQFVCSDGVPSSFLTFVYGTFNVAASSLMLKKQCGGLRSLVGLPGPEKGRLRRRIPSPVHIPFLSRVNSIFQTIGGQSVLLRFPCRSFSCLVHFLVRTTFSPGMSRVGVARCQITRGSTIVGALVDTTRGKGGIAIFIRLGTHFSRRGGVDATRQVRRTNVHVVCDVPNLGMRTGITIVLQGSARSNYGQQSFTCLDANGFGRGATHVCSSVTLLASGTRLVASVGGIFTILRKGLTKPAFHRLLITHFGVIPRLAQVVRQRVRRIGTKHGKHVILGVGKLRSRGVVGRLCGTDRGKIRVSLVIQKVYYLIPGHPFDTGVGIAHVISVFLRRSHV